MCRNVYCHEIVDGGAGYCPRCKKGRSTWKPVPAYSSRRWTNLAKAYRREHPRCERCGLPAVETHHRNHCDPSDPSFWEWTNLEALCAHEHRVVTAQQSVRSRRARA